MIFEKIGEEIDRLVTLDSGKFGPRDILRQKYYESARKSLNPNRPITLAAAERLREATKPRDIVLIATGTYWLPWYWHGETDGPPGAAVLSRALNVTLDAIPIILCEEPLWNMQEATCRAAGLTVVSLEESKASLPPRVVIQGFPSNDEEAKHEAKELLSKLKPKAFISIERMGQNEKNQYHTASGINITDQPIARFDYLMEEANSQGILTIGIGDIGNELGLGRIKDVIKEYARTGAKCQCPCGAGVAVRVPAEITLPAGVSNWGAYGIAAVLSAFQQEERKPATYEYLSPLQTGDEHRRIMMACANAGAIDGNTRVCAPTEDGLPLEVTVSLVQLMGMVVRLGLESQRDPRFKPY